jgi:pimeloyl-ACP methyl ester carboxylesterase
MRAFGYALVETDHVHQETDMTTARINGITIQYDVSGSGPAVLLTHGFSSTGRAWADQHRALGERYRVISWDMRGHGETESPDDPAQYSHDLTVADMHGLLRHLGVARAVIGGLSLGGTMSLAFYRRHPEMVRALVICDSGPGYRNADARAEWNRRAETRAADLETRGLDALQGGSRDMREAARLHRSAQGIAHAARGMLAQRDAGIIDSLPEIRVPTLVIVGDQDAPFIAPCQYMATKVPGAQLEVIKDAGHSSNLDQPEAFNRVLRGFLDALP